MAFILDDLDDTFEWQVKLLIPTKNKRRTETFNAIFKRISQERYNEIARLQDEEGLSNEDVVREIMVSWSRMQDKEGNELPYTASRLDKILERSLLAMLISQLMTLPKLHKKWPLKEEHLF